LFIAIHMDCDSMNAEEVEGDLDGFNVDNRGDMSGNDIDLNDWEDDDME
jgi:hypothetical protein